MKRKELYELQEGLENVRQSGSRFCYVVAKNKRKIDAEIVSMEKERLPSPRYWEFLKKVEDIRKKYAEKDEKGNPKISARMAPDGKERLFYEGLDMNPESDFMKEMKLLEEEYDEDIKIQKEKDQKYYSEYLEQEVDFEIHKVWLADVPKDITQEEMDGIFLMVKDE